MSESRLLCAAWNSVDFIRESNRIENITRNPTVEEIAEHERIMALPSLSVKDLERFVSVYAPGHKLRTKSNMNVSVGGYYAPIGGSTIRIQLQKILAISQRAGAYRTHVDYELLHPFTDGNGRSGRILWLWLMKETPYGFLRHFYYQTLSAARI